MHQAEGNKGIMGRWRNAIGALSLALLAAGSAQANPIGPVFPAPGGTTFAGSGSALNSGGTRTGTYSGFAPSNYSDLWFGISSMRLSMNGSGDGVMHVTSVSGNDIYLSGNTTITDVSTFQTYSVNVSLHMALFNSALQDINWITGSSVGIANPYVADVTAASASGGFFYQAETLACIGASCFGPKALFDSIHTSPFISMQTSLSTGLWYDPPAPTPTPEPESLALLGLGLAGLGLARRRKAAKA